MKPQINADSRGFKHKELTEKIIGLFFQTYNELGYGFLDSVYEEAFAITLRSAGLRYQRQIPVPVWFRGFQIGDFRADFIVEEVVLLELKAARVLEPAHDAQLLNYLRATNLEIGLLLNFGARPQFRRLAFDNNRKNICADPRSSAAATS